MTALNIHMDAQHFVLPEDQKDDAAKLTSKPLAEQRNFPTATTLAPDADDSYSVFDCNDDCDDDGNDADSECEVEEVPGVGSMYTTSGVMYPVDGQMCTLGGKMTAIDGVVMTDGGSMYSYPVDMKRALQSKERHRKSSVLLQALMIGAGVPTLAVSG